MKEKEIGGGYFTVRVYKVNKGLCLEKVLEIVLPSCQ